MLSQLNYNWGYLAVIRQAVVMPNPSATINRKVIIRILDIQKSNNEKEGNTISHESVKRRVKKGRNKIDRKSF
jgi:hypothetical protein